MVRNRIPLALAVATVAAFGAGQAMAQDATPAMTPDAAPAAAATPAPAPAPTPAPKAVAKTPSHPTEKLVDDKIIAGIREWLKNPVVAMSIESQNQRYGKISQAKIDKLDKQWVAEREKQDQPLVATTLSSPLSTYVTQVQAGSTGLYTEIIIVDDKGLNVGQSDITSDFWQGDEAKFKKTFPVGPDAVFVDAAELNKDTNTWRAQVNMTVTDDKGTAIGAATVEVNLTELARRRQASM